MLGFFLIILTFILSIILYNPKNIENFDAVGLVNNQPPNWFLKKPYNPNEWLVKVYPQHIQPSCLPYSLASKWGSLENLNYLSQPYRFWRF